jgi:hypothetical protein
MTPEARQRILNEREALEDLAESDLPCSTLAENLLEAVTKEAQA